MYRKEQTMTVEYGKLTCVLVSCVKEKVTLRNKIGGLEAEVADFRQSLAQFQDRHGRDLLRMAELVAENDTLKKAALQDQKHRRTHELAQGILERRVKELEATTAVWGGEWCAENRAAGRGPCGACAWCCKEATDRAEAAERRARRLEAAVARRTSVKVPVQERTLRDQLAAVEAECEERAETMRGQVKEIHRLEGELGAACRLNSGVEVAGCVLRAVQSADYHRGNSRHGGWIREAIRPRCLLLAQAGRGRRDHRGLCR